MKTSFSRWLPKLFLACCGLLFLLCGTSWGDGPADNLITNVRRVPKLGVEVPEDVKKELEASLATLAEKLKQLSEKKDAQTQDLLPDVEIFHKGPATALTYQEFFDVKEFEEAKRQIQVGIQRADELLQGKASWPSATGLVVRGYRSKIDGSVQPYGLIVPRHYARGAQDSWRLDIWLHGRGEVLSELNFIRDRSFNMGQISPKNTLVLHPYGRYCNAFKFAGEIDILEAMEDVKRRYAVNEDLVAIRGFSMGGAGCWQMAVHYPDLFFAATPGAGFSETPEFLRIFQKEEVKPTWWQRKLWHWYDCPDWTEDLQNLPTIAYSGEEDVQKQAADIMERAFAAREMNLLHLIGPKTKHSYHPESLAEIERRLAKLAKMGRNEFPTSLHFVTYSLRYPKHYWLTVEGIEQHWERSSVRADWTEAGIVLEMNGVTDLTIDIPPGQYPLALNGPIDLFVDEDSITPSGITPASDGSLQASIHYDGTEWKLGKRPTEEGKLRKKAGLCGPIDDAFMSSFMFVRPTKTARHPEVDKWTKSEMNRAVEQWRRHFRGDVRIKDDTEVTAEDMANHHLIVWGDTQSNTLLAQMQEKLPITWDEKEIVAGTAKHAAATHALTMVYPNPLQPTKYVVLNSGFTFREFAQLNNARQVAMLPDWAIIDLSTPADAVWPGKVVSADFFNEEWQVHHSAREEEK